MPRLLLKSFSPIPTYNFEGGLATATRVDSRRIADLFLKGCVRLPGADAHIAKVFL